MSSYKFHADPEILAAEEYINIVGDYRDPKEAIREAISNALDWAANTISIEVLQDLKRPNAELIIKIEDDGLGLNKSRLKAFFDLGNSTALETDELGHKVSDRIGEKGHGTKTFFNCREIEIFSKSSECTIAALMREPLLTLHNDHHVPGYDYDLEEATNERTG
ncbi:MAG: ATP-binding protein, partial [Chloroflexi bacterium]|nr:ATP-binding protein [Chloroflexota bacterium]